MLKISVIIPIYNTIKELKKCLDSVCNQTYKNLEIILIDDGSSDGSEQLVNDYAAGDRRIKLVHQLNQGEGYARNVGLSIATGDVIAFVDCDDWIEPEMYEELIEMMEKYHLDIAACSWFKDTDESTIKIKNRSSVCAGVFGRNLLLRYIYMRDYYQGFAYMWNKIYRREILLNSSGELVMFDTSLAIGGDVLYLAMAAVNSTRIKYSDKCFYHYYQRNNSGVHTLNCRKMRDWIEAYERVIKVFEKNKIEIETIKYVERFMGYHASNAVEIALVENDYDSKCFFQKIMDKCKESYINLNIDDKDRIDRYNRLMTV